VLDIIRLLILKCTELQKHYTLTIILLYDMHVLIEVTLKYVLV